MNFYAPSPHFNDTIDSLRNEFKDDYSDAIVVCGVYETSKTKMVADFKKRYSKVIAFNQEPLFAKQRQFMHPLMYKFIKDADEVWDYDELNFRMIKTIRPDTELHILKPYKDWSKYAPVEKDIDILFYGSMNEHRRVILEQLKLKYNVMILTDNFDTLDQYIMRSKILLNIHFFYEVAMQEQARIVRWLGAPCKILSEHSWRNYLNVPELSEFTPSHISNLV